MFPFLKKLNLRSGQSHLADYREVRAAARTWLSKLSKHPAAQRFDIKIAAPKLGIPRLDGTFIFDGEVETNLLMDYYNCDFRPQGKSLVESATFEPGELTENEAAVRAGTLTSSTSLFSTIGFDARPLRSCFATNSSPTARKSPLPTSGLHPPFPSSAARSCSTPARYL